ncbi:hypothetical protein RhiirA4_497078 [Rhizophagus irregularis]|uniref:RNase H type-1 domain-containing protein n=1 Tax=Rhizophagus irregularis TaxID=588596 RepID=A0A2I1H181_9GLOM|nr:hypothetical protein RhiirA4_497078 [Rhizophagus irregularis]
MDLSIKNLRPQNFQWVMVGLFPNSNISGVNITYNGAAEYFPSSTKAETLAILTALIVCPLNSSINIFTDSQAAIDSFHKTKNLHSISPRRFNKVNNNILWSSIHHIIKQLKLTIKLHKVKAHSGNTFNDKADDLAKKGRTDSKVATKILHDHIPSQNLTLMWE